MVALSPLLTDCRNAGITLRVESGNLIASPADGSTVPPDIVSRLRKSKPELIAHFSRPRFTVSDEWANRIFRAFDPPPARKPWYCEHPGHDRGWVSIYHDHPICQTCSPPVTSEVVRKFVVWTGEELIDAG